MITITSTKYTNSFGFTEKEVFDALDQFGLSDKKLEVKNWYDGFSFGDQEFKVFQPKKEKGLEDTVAAALRQVEEKAYEEALIVRGIPQEKIRRYGVAFRGKEVLIGR